MALSKALGSPLADWPDVWPMYRSVLKSRFEKTGHTWDCVPKVRELFSISLPCLEPSDVSEFLRALRNPRIKKFREFVAGMAENGTTLDPHLAETLLISQGAKKGKLAKVGTILNFFGTAVGVAASILDGGLTSTVLTATGTAVGNEFASRRVHDILHKDSEWLLCLIDAKNP